MSNTTPRRSPRDDLISSPRPSLSLKRSDEHLGILLRWVNGCHGSLVRNAATEEEYRETTSLSELTDGVLLWELLSCLSSAENNDVAVDANANAADSNLAASGLGRVIVRLCALLEVGRASRHFSWLHDKIDASDGNVADVVQLVLGYAVQSPLKNECVGQIMSLEPVAQHTLMVEVDVALKRIAELKELPPTPSPFNGQTIVSAPSSVSSSSSLSTSLTQSGAMKRTIRENQAIRAENEEINISNVELQRTVEILQSELGKLRSDAKESVLRKELELGDAFEEREKSMAAALERKDVELERLNAEMAALALEAKASAALRDQVEVLTAQASEAAKKDLSIQRLRNKALLANDLTKQISTLEQSNSLLLERSVGAEDAAKVIPKLRKELEMCKEAHTEALMNLNETRVQLESRSQQLRALQNDHSKLHGENAMLQSDLGQAESLQNSLSDEFNVRGDGSSENNNSESVSELNPRVRESLARLERENEALRASLNEQSEDNVSRLAFENDSLQRLRSKLEAQLSEAAVRGDDLGRQLQQAEQAHAAAQQQWERKLAQLDSELDTRGQELDAAKAGIRLESERLERLLAEAAAEQEHERARASDEQEALREQHASEREQLAEEREEALELISNLQGQLDASQDTLSAAQKEREDYEQDHRVSIEDYEQEQNELHQRIAKLEASKQALDEELSCEYKARDATLELSRELESKLADAGDRFTETAGDLESERKARHETEQAVERLRLEGDELRASQRDLEAKLTDIETSLASTKASLVDTKVNLDDERMLRQKAEHSVERYRLECDDLSHHISQTRRQLKAAQIQREQAAARQSANVSTEDQDVLAEMQRLVNQVAQLQADNTRLRSQNASGSGINESAANVVGKGVSEIARRYEKQIADMEKSMDGLSMAKTQALIQRKEMEQTYQKLAKEHDNVQAENNSLRLKLERQRMAMQNFKQQPDVLDANKENNKCQTPSKTQSSNAVPSPGLVEVRSHQPNAQLDQPAANDENQQECQQQ